VWIYSRELLEGEKQHMKRLNSSLSFQGASPGRLSPLMDTKWINQ